MTLSGASTTTTYSYNEQNRLKSIVTPLAGGKEERVYYYYDNNGNLVTKTKETINPVNTNDVPGIEVFSSGPNPTGDITLYKYNNWNQLVETIDKGYITSYKYNGDGLRVEKTANSTLTRYMYEYDKVVLEVDGSGTQKARNVYGLNLLCRTAGSDTLYYMYNGHGDVTALINAAGTIAASYYYDAFGNILSQTGSANNNITYAGYQYDSETGLYYLNARYYDSKIARFLSEDTYTGDPNDPLSLNLYTYCANSPIKYTDPSGHYYYVDANGKGHVSEITVGWNCGLNPDIIYDKVIFVGDHINVTTSGAQIGSVSGNKDIVNAYNNSNGSSHFMYIPETMNVGTVGMGSGSSTIVNNGSIENINTGAGSITNINNSGYIGTINSGTESITNIYNNGNINVFNTGAKSSNIVCNDGSVGLIHTGLNNSTVYGGGGVLGSSGGNGRFIDLSKIKPEDVTREIAKFLIGNPVNVFVTQHPYLTEFLTGVPVIDLFYAAGFVMDSDGVYHARQDALQQYGGYNFLYDIVFDYATSMRPEIFQFSYNKEDYRLWAWKGNYLNLGAGAELGLYKRLSVMGYQTDHWLADTSSKLTMTMTLEDNEGDLIAFYNLQSLSGG